MRAWFRCAGVLAMVTVRVAFPDRRDSVRHV